MPDNLLVIEASKAKEAIVEVIKPLCDRIQDLESENFRLRNALTEIEAGTILHFDESEEREVEVWMDPEDMQEIARQALTEPAPCDEPPKGEDAQAAEGRSPASAVTEGQAP